ncbi:MAG TPA: S8 family serine peptidase [Vicinamibacterales bacterium]|nr:S8 family serine peptidase [Vicinamibacterales bacterium]
MSRDLEQRLTAGDTNATSVIVTGSPARIARIAARHGLRIHKLLDTGAVLNVPAGALAGVADDAEVDQLTTNHIVEAHMAVTNQTIGADLVQAGGWAPGIQALTGNGIGVAVIDSGVAYMPEFRGRIIASKDFTDDRGPGIDLNGHGTHVAGIIAASGANRFDDTRGVAPGANIISLKVLDAKGKGVAGDVIEAIDWAVKNSRRYNIRVINMSLGGASHQGWRDDPLCQAVERAYRAGIVVVASAGNFGKTADGRSIYGGITTPGISPFAITVGALDTKGTPWRSDDEVATYSSKGPTIFDRLVKPDLVAPGSRIMSLAAPGSTIVREHPELVTGSGMHSRLQLSGTSMSAAVVSGAVGLLLDRQSHLGPLPVRILLQYSSEFSNAGILSSGSGKLNVLAALSMPRPALAPSIAGETQAPGQLVFAARPSFTSDDGKKILWGNAENILWGNANNILWGNAENILWGNAENILWGNAENILWGNADNILWGNAENILWGNAENILWGNAENILWGNAENILWGNAENILWGNAENILWGNAENILWGNAENILWGD